MEATNRFFPPELLPEDDELDFDGDLAFDGDLDTDLDFDGDLDTDLDFDGDLAFLVPMGDFEYDLDLDGLGLWLADGDLLFV
ncbi:unnamed protein product [Arabis nemorensis]|uniref:Uncharacterized protein n=1 Tax=Arabis nemorensis TaxID=586526 RepID=A0A565CMI7_9BRAS|nr:unnamed protein product [Arabis nemorensis]